MALSTSFLPNKDAALLAWSLNFSTRITATPTAYGLVAGDATSYATLHTAYATALAACDPDERNKIVIATKNTARTALKVSARLLAKRVEGTATVTDAQKLELGLNVRAMPSPIPPPANAPGIGIVGVAGNVVKVRLFDPADAATRGKPAGVYGASLFSFVGTAAPTDIGQWKFEGNTGRTRRVVEFDNTVAAGARVWLTAFWFNGRKQSGPAATPVSTNVQGGGVSLAA
jgi:hypothetical protein